PDGEWVYFNSDRAGNFDIWRVRPDGSDLEQITSDDYEDWFPHPSPDGETLAYVGERADGLDDIYLTASDGSAEPRRLTSGVDARFVAWDPISQSERWRVNFASREDGGALATAGDLVFGADSSGTLHAFDAATGDALWRTDLLDSIAPPITYELDGVQYVAVLSGSRNNDPPGELFVFALDGRTADTSAK
ncbi:MAG: PQQ-binding-like beta-propeller repeat protein, partial [Gammaproteobacteria bacterium]|nr:PQQ-binding-like beta-propeller repeat protein [Gammaproteobacteria bacterium]